MPTSAPKLEPRASVAPGKAALFPGAIHLIDECLSSKGWKKIFVVSQNEAYVNSGAAAFLDPILSHYEVSWFTQFSPNPKLEEMLGGVAAFRQCGAQVVLAVGGGSAIDMGKLIASLSPQREAPLQIITGAAILRNAPVQLIAIPTTAGTGSEATDFAVIYVDGRKYSLAHPGLMPSHAFIDPVLTESVPPYLTAVTGLDAFSQAVESFWSIHATEESSALAREALQLAWDHLEEAVTAPTPQSRLAMCRASHLAGRAIRITKTTAPHAISYAMTSRFGLPHGHAVAMTLGPLLLFNFGAGPDDNCHPLGPGHLRAVINEIVEALHCRTATEACGAIRAKMERIGCASSLSAVGIAGEENLQYLCDQVNAERLANNPRLLSPVALRSILLSIA